MIIEPELMKRSMRLTKECELGELSLVHERHIKKTVKDGQEIFIQRVLNPIDRIRSVVDSNGEFPVIVRNQSGRLYHWGK